MPHYGLGLIELQAGNYLKATEAFEELLIPIMHSSQRQQNTAK